MDIYDVAMQDSSIVEEKVEKIMEEGEERMMMLCIGQFLNFFAGAFTKVLVFFWTVPVVHSTRREGCVRRRKREREGTTKEKKGGGRREKRNIIFFESFELGGNNPAKSTRPRKKKKSCCVG